MTAAYTNNLRFTLQSTNSNPNTWGTVLNTVLALVEEAVTGVAVINCTGSSDIDLSATTVNGASDDARHAVLELTGTIGANINLTLPSVDKIYFVRANFTGAFTITVKAVGGASGIAFANTSTKLLYTNGTLIYSLSDSTALFAANNLSDLVSAATARTNLGLGTAAVLDTGTSANQVVKLNGSAQLPAIDGSLLTGISTGGTMAAQNANNVAITGGTITGITDLAIADGGTGASTAAQALINLGLTQTVAAVGKLVFGAVTIQWGESPVGAVTFATAFSGTPYAVVQAWVGSSGDNTGILTKSSTGFTKAGNGLPSTWIAIGPT